MGEAEDSGDDDSDGVGGSVRECGRDSGAEAYGVGDESR